MGLCGKVGENHECDPNLIVNPQTFEEIQMIPNDYDPQS